MPKKLTVVNVKNIHKAFKIVKLSGLITTRNVVVLVIFYAIASVSAFLDGFSLVTLFNLVIDQGKGEGLLLEVTTFIFSLFNLEYNTINLFFLTIGLFVMQATAQFLLQALEGFIPAVIRRQIQEKAFKQLIYGDWESLRNLRTGKLVGAVTEEVAMIVKFVFSFMRSFYFLIALAIFASMAVSISPGMSVMVVLVGAPFSLFLQWLFRRLSKVSKVQADARQSFAADLGERLLNLFQIKVEGNNDVHYTQGTRAQNEFTRSEIKNGLYYSLIISLRVIIPVIGLGAYYLWTLWENKSMTGSFMVLAGIGVLGMRAMNYLNNLLAMYANVSRFSGSLDPVIDAIMVEPERERTLFSENIERVELDEVTYAFGDKAVIENVTLQIEPGEPCFLKGPSGSGKTTLANLIAGIIFPQAGVVKYVTNLSSLLSTDHKAKIGYVTQDIQLFHGSVRDNLTSYEDIDENFLWECLELCGARPFVERLGGLDGEISEAGRSLSGGEKRRLGIARTLCKKPQMRILAEMTLCLDPENKKALIATINDVAKRLITVLITHDVEVRGEKIFELTPGAA